MRLLLLSLLLLFSTSGFAQVPAGHPSAPASTPTISPYARYEFLIGEWTIGNEGGPPAMIVRFRWGSGQAYLWYSASMVAQTPYGVLVAGGRGDFRLSSSL